MGKGSGLQRLGMSSGESVHCRHCLSDRRLHALTAIHGTPLLVVDCSQIRRNYQSLQAALPGVALHYAVKALPEAAVLDTLRDEGSNFDVASISEIEVLLKQGVLPDRMIHTHPIKTPSEIQAAIGYGCRTFVFDNVDELRKFQPFRDRLQLILRIGFRNAYATVDLSKKFGAPPGDALGLLELARRLGLRTIGLSFHVGSQCTNSHGHVAAIETCKELLAAAHDAGLPAIRLLDIGGGFPAPYTDDIPEIDSFCAPIGQALATLPRHVRVVSEPGRYLVASAGHSVASVIGKAKRGGTTWYYLDDGIYGSFGAQVFDRIFYPLSVVTANTGSESLSYLAGPTCDSGDMVSDGIVLPDLDIGDLIVAHLMGAYSSVTANDFNSVKRAKIVAVDGPTSSKDSGTMLKASAE
jgi:ornithine decarboxylase